jgi:hypothetical protein
MPKGRLVGACTNVWPTPLTGSLAIAGSQRCRLHTKHVAKFVGYLSCHDLIGDRRTEHRGAAELLWRMRGRGLFQLLNILETVCSASAPRTRSTCRPK